MRTSTSMMLLSAVGALTLSTPAHAEPTQTMEGAHQFFELLAQSGTLKAQWKGMSPKNSTAYGERYWEKDTGGSYCSYRCKGVDRVAPQQITYTGSSCKSSIKGDNLESYWVGSNMVWPYYTSTSVDWSKISNVKSNGSNVWLVGVDILLVLPDENYANRLVVAGNFIRQRCDATTSTGF